MLAQQTLEVGTQFGDRGAGLSVVLVGVPGEADGAALLERAAEALAGLDVGEIDTTRPVPRLPLFGALSPPALQQLLSVWEIRSLAEGEAAIEEAKAHSPT